MSKMDIKKDNEKRLKNKVGRKHRRDWKLQDLERQLEFAESRCGTLKQQLDYIKQMYGGVKGMNFEKQSLKEEGHGDGADANQFNFAETSKLKQLTRILVNKEIGDGSELLPKSVSHSNTVLTASSLKYCDQEKQDENAKKSLVKMKPHLKLSKGKKKNLKRIKKRGMHNDSYSSKVSNASSQTQNKIWQDPVVEIYKNLALNAESESRLEIFDKTKAEKSNELLYPTFRQKMNEKISSNKPNEVRSRTKAKSSNKLNEKTEIQCFKEEGIQTEPSHEINSVLNQINRNDLIECINRENTNSENLFLEPSKGYCQPTISSKRKQVERDIYSNLSNLKIKNIPFIAARSTAPSHNIGVNIQQVLSIIKKCQPKGEVLAYNDYRNRENSVLTMISSRKIGSKTNQYEAAPPPSAGLAVTTSSEFKKQNEVPRTSLSHWRTSSETQKDNTTELREKPDNGICFNYTNNTNDSNNGVIESSSSWNLKVEKLKKVLVFLHEDFTSLSQKYKRLQKKLTKRNITKTEAKGELADIERDLEKKEEEITVVIALYKEVVNLREDFKALQEKYSAITSGRGFVINGLQQSSSAHTQMTALLRKIQNFQGKLKG